MEQTRGFTLVEIIIVCVVLGLLVSVGAIGWSSTLIAGRDRVRAGELADWEKRYDNYRRTNFVYPNTDSAGNPLTGEYCLGSNFPGGICKKVSSPISESSSAGLQAELEKAGQVPNYAHVSANGYIGPWVRYYPGSPGSIRLYHSFEQSSCPNNTTKDSSFTGATICYIELTQN